MPYTVSCPSCGTKTYLSSGFRGATTDCRGCGARFDVTAAGTDLRTPRPEPITLVLNPDPDGHKYTANWQNALEGPTSAPRRHHRRSRVARRLRSFLATCLLGLLVGLVGAACWSAMSVLVFAPAKIVPPAQDSPEFQVALFDIGDEGSPRQRDVYKFRFLIRQISATYEVTAEEAARAAIETAERLQDLGITTSMTDLLNGAIEASDSRGDIGLNTPSFTQYLASYEHYRGKGQDHRGTIETINRLKLL